MCRATNRRGEKKCIKPRVVESSANVAARGQKDSFFSFRNLNQLFSNDTPLLYSHATFQNHDVFHQTSQPGYKFIHLPGALRQKNR
jgi:hypothetical protein